jgi:hypothetical protein
MGFGEGSYKGTFRLEVGGAFLKGICINHSHTNQERHL